jgi:hypothetical protein
MGSIMKRLVGLGIGVAVCLGAISGSPGAAFAANAGENHASYMWIIGGTGDTAIAPNGSTITMAGTGMLQAGPGHTANGGGTFTTSGGSSGTFTVTGMEGFVSYGSGAAQGLPANFFGGEAKLRVALSDGTSGVLTIFCLLGSPPMSKMEGINLILGTGGDYTKQDGGNTLFIQS